MNRIIPGTNLFVDADPTKTEEVYLYRTAIVTFTNDEIKALANNDASILGEIVPAPGANKIIFPLELILVCFVTTSYTNLSAGVQIISFVGPDDNSGFISLAQPGNIAGFNPLTGFFNTAPEGNVLYLPVYQNIIKIDANTFVVNPSGYFIPDIANQPLNFYIFNSGGAFTGGDAANKLKAIVRYSVLDVNKLR